MTPEPGLERLGVLGGSFDPVHLGHLSMADAARSAHRLDRVLFVPTGRPPHKTGLTPAEDRLAMVRLALEGLRGFEACSLEVDRPGTSFTVDTLKEISKRHPGAEIFFIIGEDSIPELPGWREASRVVSLARIVAVNRPGAPARFRLEDFPGVPREAIERMERDRVIMTPSPLESRRIREAARAGRRLTGMVPPSVEAYIRAHGLYRAS